MDLFNDAWNLDEVLDEDAGNELKDESSRDACIFLLEQNLKHADLVCSACSARVQDRLISNPKDMIGLILFDSKEATVIFELQTPTVEMVSQIESLPKMLEVKGPKEDNCGLNEALWICSRVFSRCNQKMYSKRVMLFTDVDDPYPQAKKGASTDKLLRRQVLQRSKDLYDAGVRVDVIPSGDGPFSYAKFYQHVMFKADEEITEFETEVSLDSLLRRIRRKDYPMRAAVAAGRLRLATDEAMVAPSFSLYRIVQATGCPSKVRIDRRTDKEVVNSRRMVVQIEIGSTAPILPSDISYQVSVAGREARFAAQELSLLPENLKETDLLLIGFKPIECLRATYFLKPGYILVANDKKCYNSSRVFNALYLQCMQRHSFILCRLIMPRGSCHLVSLVPDSELETFYVVILPFADDIRPSQAERGASESNEAKISETAIDAMSSIVKKLCKPFDPTETRNPVIVHFWQMLEAVALNRSIPAQDLPDIPIVESNDVKDLAKQFNSIVMPSQKSNEKGGKKKRNYSEVDESCSMAELRQLAKDKGIKLPARCKKADAVELLKKNRRS